MTTSTHTHTHTDHVCFSVGHELEASDNLRKRVTALLRHSLGSSPTGEVLFAVGVYPCRRAWLRVRLGNRGPHKRPCHFPRAALRAPIHNDNDRNHSKQSIVIMTNDKLLQERAQYAPCSFLGAAPSNVQIEKAARAPASNYQLLKSIWMLLFSLYTQ